VVLGLNNAARSMCFFVIGAQFGLAATAKRTVTAVSHL
jgi:hypothetical protein